MIEGVRIDGGRALIGGAFVETTVHITADGTIGALGSDAPARQRIDASGLLVLPGIVDIHGDAFERQIMPRPGVNFPVDIALFDTDRQVVANGITTVFHGVTWSWEPGLRGAENARAILGAMERLRPRLAADTHFHLRHETFNLDAEPEIAQWLSERRIGLLAFNDHMTSIVDAPDRREKLKPMLQRSGLSEREFDRLVERTKSRGDDVSGSIERLARIAIESGVPLLSHDDNSPEQRNWYRSLGCRVAEFPTNVETSAAAKQAGDDIVLGAPNVVRGGSHTGWTRAADMVADGCCTILASDYYYPAPLLAAFRLHCDHVLPLERAWEFVSLNPSQAISMFDRGRIAIGLRADLILVDPNEMHRPRAVATIAAGRVAYLTDSARCRGDVASIHDAIGLAPA